jgi:hypothetical protein
MTTQEGNSMPSNNWLPLNEYSAKYKISLSTLRRRIRGDEVVCKFEGGKYLLPDSPIVKHLNVGSEVNAVDAKIKANQMPLEIQSKNINTATNTATNTEANNEIVAELKRAYVSVLQEKEEIIIMLKEEIVDQNILIKILESENERLKGQLRQPPL